MDIANFKERIAKALAPDVFERAEAAKRRLRPPLETIFQMGYQESEAGVKLPNVPRFKGSYRQLYNVVYSLYILRQVIEKITQETFRNVEDEWEWIPVFAARCAVCGAEYEKEEPEQCEECGSNQFIYPDEKQKELFEEFVKKANVNGQSLFDVLREISKDLDIADDAYLVVLKDYVLTHDGHIFQAIPKEILRGSPETFRLVANDDGFPGGRWWKCLHPGCNYVLEEPDREKAKHARCPEHNMVLHDVWYVVIDPKRQEKPVRYYLKNEVFHASKHNPTILYGFSPVITLYSIAEALLAMVGYIRDTYLLERPPKAGLFVQTSNPKSLEKVWDEAMQKKKTNPNYLPVIAIEGEGRTGAQFISFMDSIEELQYLAVLEEFRRGISAQYGVSLIFQSDTSASGGLNNEGLQITVTNRAVESARTAIQKFIIFLMEQFSITDWMFMLPPVEERDEMAEKQRFAQEIQNAHGMLKLGYVPTLEDNLTFSYEYDPDKAKELLGQGDMVMQNPLQIAEPQRMEGEPESMHRSVFDKARRYIKDPSEAPPGAKVRQGARGGYYYETEGGEKKEGKQKKIKKKEFPHELNIPPGQTMKFDVEGTEYEVTNRDNYTPKEQKVVMDEINAANDFFHQRLKDRDFKNLLKKLKEDEILRNTDERKDVKIHAILSKDPKEAGFGNSYESGMKIFTNPKRDNYAVSNSFTTLHELHHIYGSTSELDPLSDAMWIDFVLTNPEYDTEVGLNDILRPVAISKVRVSMGQANSSNRQARWIFDYLRKKHPEEIERFVKENFNPADHAHLLEKSDDDIIPDPDRLLIKAYFDQVWEAIHKEDTLWDNYEGLTEAQIEQVNNILTMHFTRPRISLREIMKDLIEIGVDDNQARMIARTEMTAVVNKAREIDWKEQDPEGEYLYRWQGPLDERTTEICKELMERSRNGLPLNELKTLVREVSKKYLGEEWKSREWVPHVACRHTFVRVR